MYREGLKRGSCGNCTTRLILNSHRSVLGIRIKWECKIVLRSAPVVGYERVCMIPLYYV